MTDKPDEIDEILDRVYLFGMNGGLGYGKFDNELAPYEAKQQLLALKSKWEAEAYKKGCIETQTKYSEARNIVVGVAKRLENAKKLGRKYIRISELEYSIQYELTNGDK